MNTTPLSSPLRSAAVAALAATAALAGTAPAADAAAKFEIGQFLVEVEGVQTTTWTTNHVKAHACDADANGSGKETVRFRSAPTQMKGYRGLSTPVLLFRPGAKPAEVALRSKITRNGTLTRGPSEVCAHGNGGGSAPPAPDCGTKRSNGMTVRLAFLQRPRHLLVLNPHDAVPLGPFRNCPMHGDGWPTLIDFDSNAKPIGQRVEPAELWSNGQYVVVARGSTRQTSGETRYTTKIRWSVSFKRLGKR